jgi:hypothetical protein
MVGFGSALRPSAGHPGTVDAETLHRMRVSCAAPFLSTPCASKIHAIFLPLFFYFSDNLQ